MPSSRPHCSCAPGVTEPFCLSADDYRDLAEAYNSLMRRLSPGTEGEMWQEISPEADPWEIVRQLASVVDLTCHDVRCLSESEFFDQLLGERAALIRAKFKPIGPEGENGWLSNRDLDRIMEGYQAVYPGFRWLGAVPADCADYSYCQLGAVDWDSLREEDVREAGVIFNRSLIGSSGSHWVSLYFDLSDKPKVYFSDSAAKPPTKPMLRFIQRFISWCEDQGLEPEQRINQIAYQKDKTECGVYSVYFLVRLLAGHTFDQIVEDRPDYQLIQGCRRYYFGQDGRAHPTCDPDRLR